MSKRLLTNSLIFFIGNLVLSVFNYLYNTFMGRYLGPANYSIIGSLLAFMAIITIPTNAVGTVAMRFTANYHAKGDDGAVNSFFRNLTKSLGIVAVVALAAMLIASPFLKEFLHLPSITPILLLAPMLIFSILLPLNRGILQGLQRFVAAIVNQGVDPFIKLVLGVGLVQLGFGINGAIVAIVIGLTIAYLLSFIPLRTILKEQPKEKKVALPDEVKQFSSIALVAFLLSTVLMNIDILLVKHFLPAQEAGLYTALSNIGKIVLFVSAPVIGVMFPMISDLQGREKKHYHILMLSFILVATIGFIGVAGYYLLPELVVKVLYGPAYISIAPLLGLFGITMLLFSLINLWVNYFLSIGNSFFVCLLGLSVVVEVVLLYLNHDSFYGVINSLLAAMITGFTLLSLYYLFLKRRQILEVLPAYFSSNQTSS